MPTIAELTAQIEALQAENALLKLNPNYGILNRQGLELEHRKLTGPRYAVMIDIDYLHELNERHGSQEPVNELIRSAFAFRDDDLLIAGNWASGDEVAFIVRADPDRFMARLAESLAQYGLSATMAAQAIENDDLIAACLVALENVYTAKRNRGMKSR